MCVIYLLIISFSIDLLIVIVKSMSWLIASAVQHLFHTALVICLRAYVLIITCTYIVFLCAGIINPTNLLNKETCVFTLVRRAGSQPGE